MKSGDVETTTIEYVILYGPEKIDDRETKTFTDHKTAVDFFTEKSRTMSVNAFRVTKTTNTITEKLA